MNQIFKPPFRLGKKKKHVILDSLGKEVIVFKDKKLRELQAAEILNLLNSRYDIWYGASYTPH